MNQLVNVLSGSDVVLTSASGVGAPGIAEFVFARLLQIWKHLRRLDDQQNAHTWQPQHGERLAGRTLGIVGLGAIGTEVARRARAFDMRVMAIRARPDLGAPDSVDWVMGPEGLEQLLAEADAVVLSVPLTRDTDTLIGAPELALMRRGAILCNVARGALVDESALVSALVEGHIGAAVLDVTRKEPLPPDSPLWSTRGVYLSPHTSNSMEDYASRLASLFADNLDHYVRGLPLINRVRRED
ncbi:MAG: D-2-hydroxyacid dehydrogenase [Actinomycetota bacterium]